MANNMMAQANISKMKAILNAANTQERLATYMDKADSKAFVMSVLNLYTGDMILQNCDPNLCLAECMKAAALSLPIAKQLGYCYIIGYGGKPAFQMGYKGWLQLAIRSGLYATITAFEVYEGQNPQFNKITEEFTYDEDGATSENVIGYFARFELKSGFHKALYWTKEKVLAHAKRYSQAYKAGKKDSPWFTAPDAMGCKTVLLQILTKYGIMSTVMQNQYLEETDERVEAEVAQNANGAPVTIPTQFADPEMPAPEQPQPPVDDDDPGF